MANGIEGFLSQKIGPVPYWMVGLGVAGVVGIVVYRRQSAAATSTGPQGAPGTGPFAPSPIIVTPNNMPDSTSSVNAPPPPTAQAGAMVTVHARPGYRTASVSLWPTPAATVEVTEVPDGTTLPSGGPPVQGQNVSVSQGGGATSNWWQPVKYAGTTLYVWAPDATVSGGSGQGGGGKGVTSTRMLPGGGKVTRFLTPHAHPQYVSTGMGGSSGGEWGPWGFGAPPPNQPRGSEATPGATFQGPGYGGGGRAAPAPSRGIRAVSARTGISHIRLMALNPGHWRPGSGRRSDTVFIH